MSTDEPSVRGHLSAQALRRLQGAFGALWRSPLVKIKAESEYFNVRYHEMDKN
jgi:hypothetical protein